MRIYRSRGRHLSKRLLRLRFCNVQFFHRFLTKRNTALTVQINSSHKSFANDGGGGGGAVVGKLNTSATAAAGANWSVQILLNPALICAADADKRKRGRRGFFYFIGIR